MTDFSDIEMYEDSGSDFGEYKQSLKTKKVAVKKPATKAKDTKTAPILTKPKKKKQPLAPSSVLNRNTLSDSEEERSSKKVSSKTDNRTVEEIYQKKTQLEHVLLRPDTYIGSVEAIAQPLWVFNSKLNCMEFRNVTIVPGLYKIVDEILVNAADNKQRDPNMNTLKITIDREKNFISVYNNGRGIPIEMHKDENVYVPELIFGHLLTSSNYNDKEKKVTGGRNGYGAKLCNIFSTEFWVETADKECGKKYKQGFFDNMSRKDKPQITSNSKMEEYTKISFCPDLKKFGMSHIDEDFEALLKKRVYDMAGCIKDVKVFLNDERINIKNWQQYVELYVNSTQKNETATKPVVVHMNGKDDKNERWEVSFGISDGQFQQVSFVNGIATTKGGTHVDYITDQISKYLLELANKNAKKDKCMELKKPQVKNHLWVFVNCLIENPTFDSQTKENMTLSVSHFGSKCALSDDYLKKISKSGVLENILAWAKFKQDQQLKKTNGHKRERLTGITKLEDANNAGTKNGHKCTLILTEGDSAKALVVAGLSIVGRENYGVFPLKGKLLNVREATHSQIQGNTEITHIKQIMGLQHNKAYQSVDSLRYGSIMIMTDQDYDGSHIKGLIINFLDTFFPSLLKVPGFLLEFITPIVKVTRGKVEKSFFTIPEYESWKEQNNNGKGWIVKYYKGLGTSTKEDAKEYFSKLNLHRKEFSVIRDEERELVDLAFNKKKTDDRKEWLRQYKSGTYMDHSVDKIRISDFINKELILFSMADNIRSIPSVVDGLKPGQRKVMFASFKKNIKTEIKVSQFGGYISEHSAYHHGEKSLETTIVNLAQDFVGSNNINLLSPRGQFGTRAIGGKDAASSRYIFTAMPAITRTIFHPDDDSILNYLNDDGQSIEPEWYVPILPLVLVNGGEGIGTGWSTFIPNYNPVDIVNNLRRLMRGEEIEPMVPWYKGFTGTIEKMDHEKYKITGIIRKLDDVTVEITELPLRVWTQSYKEQLQQWMEGKEKEPGWIKDIREYHTTTNVHFVVTLTQEGMKSAEAEGFEKRFKLTSQLSASNMVCFDPEGRIKKYQSVTDMLSEFYDLRLSYYQKRWQYLLSILEQEYDKLDNKVRFILMIIEGKLVIQKRKKKDIVLDLKAKNFHLFYPHKEVKNNENDGGAEEGSDEEMDNGESLAKGYDYLLSMPLWSLTYEKVEKLNQQKAEKRAELDTLSKLNAKDLWTKDLDMFLVEWSKMLDEDKKNSKTRTKVDNKRPTGKAKSSKASLKKKPWEEEDENDDNAASISDEDEGIENDFNYQPAKPKPVAKKPVARSIKEKLSVTKEAKKENSIAQPTLNSGIDTISRSSKKAPEKEAEYNSDDSDELPLMERLEKFRQKNIAAKTNLLHPRSENSKVEGNTKVPAAKKAKPEYMDLSDTDSDFDDSSKKPTIKSAPQKLVKVQCAKKDIAQTTKKPVISNTKKRVIHSEDGESDSLLTAVDKYNSESDIEMIEKEPAPKATKRVIKPVKRSTAKAIKGANDDIDPYKFVEVSVPLMEKKTTRTARAATKAPVYVDLSEDESDAYSEKDSDFED